MTSSGNDKTTLYLLLLEDEVPDLGVPAGEGCREVGVELAGAGAVCGALADLQVDEELAGGGASFLQHFLAIDLREERRIGR